MGPSQYRSRKAPADTCRTVSYSHHRHLLNVFLFRLCYAIILATASAVSNIYIIVFKRSEFWEVELSQQCPSFPSGLEALHLLLPCDITSNGTTVVYTKVHIWISPSRNHLSRSFCGLCDRGTRIFAVIPGNHKHFTHA